MTTRTLTSLSGRELAAFRRELGLNQTELARAAGVGRNAVSYWECKANVCPANYAPRRILRVLGVSIRRDLSTHPTPLDRLLGRTTRKRSTASASSDDAEQAPAAATKCTSPGKCGARTRKGRPCQLAPEPGRTRCRVHGGLSTGAKTPEGRARIAEAQRRRWAAWRAEREAPLGPTSSS
jgi:transcriptional regulator with XRE-family HTH domain